MTRIIQIATGHQSLKANYDGQAALIVVIWALVEDEGVSDLVGMVTDPGTRQLVRADQLKGFCGYTP